VSIVSHLTPRLSLCLTRTSLVRQVMVNTCCRWDDIVPGSALAYLESIVPPSCAYLSSLVASSPLPTPDPRSPTQSRDPLRSLLASRRDIYSNGTIVVANRCEKGKVVAPDTYYWISSTTACPSDDEPFPEWSRTTFDTQNLTSLPSPDFGNLTCSRGSRPAGSDTRVASLGLDPAYENATGVYQLTEYPVIPPPYDEANSSVEPVAFAYPGITPAVDGIWDIVGLDAFRTIAGDGTMFIEPWECGAAPTSTRGAHPISTPSRSRSLALPTSG